MFGFMRRRPIPLSPATQATGDERAGGFLNFYAWRPGGYQSGKDEAAINYASTTGLGAWRKRWEQHAALHTIADEAFCRNSYQYIPTEQQVIAANAIVQMRNLSEPMPDQSLNTPAGMRLVQALYVNANALWAELAQISEMGG